MGHRMKIDSGDDGFTLLGMNHISFFFPILLLLLFQGLYVMLDIILIP